MKGKRILDVGCGHGYIFEFCRSVGADAVGIDIQWKELKVPHRGYFIVGDAQNLPLRDKSFDAIIAFELVEHLHNPEKSLEEFYRCLREGGMLLLTTPTPKSPFANYIGHVSVREREFWINKLKQLGFNVKLVTYRYPLNLKLPSIITRILELLVGIWKRYVNVTSTKLIAIKERANKSNHHEHLNNI